MRTLISKPLLGGKFDGLVPVKKEISAYIRWHCERFILELESGPIKAFLKKDRLEESRAQMINCWLRAAEIFTQLQTQLANVNWSDARQQGLVGLKYNESYFEVHRSQAFLSRSNKGKPIRTIISPFVSLSGNEDGEEYDKRRIISKATVLVARDGRC